MSSKYSHLEVFKQPMCIIDSDSDNNLFDQGDVLRQISEIEEQINVVAIAGLYRTGKSYLLNRLAGQNKGFPLGSTVVSKTKGIWIWCRWHPKQPGQVLVLLDTEGLGDIKKGNRNHDNWIFALTTLLCSTLVFNHKGVFDSQALEKLHFITEMSKHVKTKESQSKTSQDDVKFDYYFPRFVLALRDFDKELEIDGRPITADEYLEDCLTLDKEDEMDKQNAPRKCLRRYFKSRRCFTFDRPTNRTKDLYVLETLSESDLNPDFLEDARKFCDFVLTECPPMKLDNGFQVNGRVFCHIIQNYVNAVRSGAIPCVENALNSMAEIENRKAMDESVKLYESSMKKRLNLPTPDQATMSNAHSECLREAVAVFLKNAILDKDNRYQERANVRIDEIFQRLQSQNRDKSLEASAKCLEQLNETIVKNMTTGTYTKPGGYQEYQQDMMALRKTFEQTKGLGIMAKDALWKYLEDKIPEGQAILNADKGLQQKEKQLEVEKMNKLAVERQFEQAEKRAKDIEETLAQQAKTFQENYDQLQRKREKEQQEMKEHFESVLQNRLNEQERTLKEGFLNEAQKMQQQIQNQLEEQRKAQNEAAEEKSRLIVEQRKMAEEMQNLRRLAEEQKQNHEKHIAELGRQMELDKDEREKKETELETLRTTQKQLQTQIENATPKKESSSCTLL